MGNFTTVFNFCSATSHAFLAHTLNPFETEKKFYFCPAQQLLNLQSLELCRPKIIGKTLIEYIWLWIRTTLELLPMQQEEFPDI